MIVKASNKCLVQWLVPNKINPSKQVETVSDSLVPSSCSSLSPSAAQCHFKFSPAYHAQTATHQSMIQLQTVLFIKTY